MARWVVTSVVLGGCASCPPLNDVGIGGRSEVEISAARDELVAFGVDLLPEICIDHVRIGHLPPGKFGAYDVVTHRVVVRSGLDPVEMRQVLRHEVCHAVDFQNDLVSGRELAFIHPDPPPSADARAPNEAFAETCAIGAEGLAALWSMDCPSDPDLRAAAIVRSEVFGADEVDPAVWFQPVASHLPMSALPPERTGPITSVSVHESEEDARLRILLGGSDWVWSYDADAWTGELLADVAPYREVTATPSAMPEGWIARSDQTGSGAYLSDGTQIVSARLPLVTGLVSRLHAARGGEWFPVEAPCPSETQSLFLFDGEPWLATLDDDVLQWGRFITANPATLDEG